MMNFIRIEAVKQEINIKRTAYNSEEKKLNSHTHKNKRKKEINRDSQICKLNVN